MHTHMHMMLVESFNTVRVTRYMRYSTPCQPGKKEAPTDLTDRAGLVNATSGCATPGVGVVRLDVNRIVREVAAQTVPFHLGDLIERVTGVAPESCQVREIANHCTRLGWRSKAVRTRQGVRRVWVRALPVNSAP